MTASIHALGKGADAGLYYMSVKGIPSRSRGRNEYYSDGEGIWWSNGETLVRKGSPVDPATFRLLCAGLDPRTGKPLVKGAGKDHRAGWDVTFSAPKSLSVLWMAGTSLQRQMLLKLHEAAVENALAFVEAEGLFQVRMGAGGSRREAANDLIVGRFTHASARSGDPNLHTHCVVMNAAGSADQKFRTLETRQVYEFQLVLGAAYRAEVSLRLHELGLSVSKAGANQIEISGISPNVLNVFSKRSAQIRAVVGLNASAAEKELAALSTRDAKDEVPVGPELELRWQAELRETGVDVWRQAFDVRAPSVDAAIEPSNSMRVLDPPFVDGDSPVVRAACDLFTHESVLTRKSLLHRSLVAGAYIGKGIASICDDLRALESDRRLLPLGNLERTAAWTTHRIASLEASLQSVAARANECDWFRQRAVDGALALHSHLSDEQRTAVLHALGSDGVSIVEAGAGTGKTTLSAALVTAANSSNLKIVGLAPSWVAADQLRRETGIDSIAIAKWRHDIRADRQSLDERTLVIMDEAGMVGLLEMEDVLRRASLAGAKVILIGDRRQLAPVGPGGALRLVADVLEKNATLQNVRRQSLDWQRQASELMATDDPAQGLFAYVRNDRVAMVSGDVASKARVVAEWSRLRREHGGDAIIITRRNRDAESLNAMARLELRKEGALGGEDIVVQVTDAEGNASTLVLARGDRIRFRQQVKDLAIRNGSLSTVVDIRPSERASDPMIKVRFDDGRVNEFRWQALASEQKSGRSRQAPRVTHAYCGTVYSVQGRTVNASVLYISGATDAREIYVGLTRHRNDAIVVVEADRLDAIARRRNGDRRPAPSASALTNVLLAEADGVREKLNVKDFDQRPALSLVRRAYEFAMRFTPMQRIRTIASVIARAPARVRSNLPNLDRDQTRTR